MPAQGAPGHVEPAAAACQHRLHARVALEIGRQRFGAVVALGRLLRERLADDGIEVARQLGSQPARRRAAQARAGRVDVQQARWRDRRRHQFGVQGRRRARAGVDVQAIGPPSGQQLVEHDAQRVHVRGRGQRLAGQLFRRGRLRRQRSSRPRRRVRVAREGIVEETRDAEVEQSHLPVGRDEDVRRLEIAVDDEPRVRVPHGAQHLLEQGDALRGVQAMLVRVARDRQAGDPLHREIRATVRAHAGVVETRDLRMLEAGQQVAFVREALGRRRGIFQADVRDLQGDAAHHVDRLFGQPDGGHASLAERLEQAVRAQHHSGREGRQARVLSGQRRGDELGRWPAQRIARGRPLVGLDEPPDVDREVRPRRLETIQPGRAIRGSQVHGVVEQRRHLGPERRRDVHGRHASRRQRCSWARMKARALSQ